MPEPLRKALYLDHDFQSMEPDQLSFKKGDILRTIKVEGEWSFGELQSNGKMGWVPSDYGHKRIEEASPYSDITSKERGTKRKETMQLIISSEQEFVSALKVYLETIVAPISLRDTDFKRAFMNQAAVAVSFELLKAIYNTCLLFVSALQNAKTEGAVANAYSQLSLPLFAQYTSENSKFLYEVKRNSRALLEFCEGAKSEVEGAILLPLMHYQKYKQEYQQIIWLTPDESASPAAKEALNSIIDQTEYIDLKLQEEDASLRLLKLQDDFSGNPVIFTGNRRLLKEGNLERVKLKADELVGRPYYAHLFNDAFIFSAVSLSSSKRRFKLHKAVELDKIEIQRVTESISDPMSDSFSFRISNQNAGGEKATDQFRFDSEEEASLWFDIITKQIKELKAIGDSKTTTRRKSLAADGAATVNAVGPLEKSLRLQGETSGTRGPRAALIYEFLLTESTLTDVIGALNSIFIGPLMNATKGASLKIPGSGEQAALFNKSAQNNKTLQVQISEALEEADIQIFLRAAEALSVLLPEFVTDFKNLCIESKWKEDLTVAPLFCSVKARALFDQFKSYAAGERAIIRALKNPNFGPFYLDAEETLATMRGSLADKISIPRDAIKRYISFFKNMQVITPATDSAMPTIISTLQALGSVDVDIDGTVKVKINYEKLLEIRSNMEWSAYFGSADTSVIQNLVTMQRTFIKCGDLKKVCRKNNKTFCFWLFNDYLLYGTPSGSGKYTFNRSLDLLTLTVGAHKSSNDAFEIFGTEKSFVVIAASSAVKVEWIEAIGKAKEGLAGKAGAVTEVEHAPLWVQDKEDKCCSVCFKDFSFFFRRHHCRKCGSLVCSDHSLKKQLLVHIDKNSPIRVCDTCFSDGNSSGVPRTTSVMQQPSQGGESKLEAEKDWLPAGRTASATPATPTKSVNEDTKTSYDAFLASKSRSGAGSYTDTALEGSKEALAGGNRSSAMIVHGQTVASLVSQGNNVKRPETAATAPKKPQRRVPAPPSSSPPPLPITTPPPRPLSKAPSLPISSPPPIPTASAPIVGQALLPDRLSTQRVDGQSVASLIAASKKAGPATTSPSTAAPGSHRKVNPPPGTPLVTAHVSTSLPARVSAPVPAAVPVPIPAHATDASPNAKLSLIHI